MNMQGIKGILNSNLDNFANLFKQNIDDISESATKVKDGQSKNIVNEFFDSLSVDNDERLRHIAGTLKRRQNLVIDETALKGKVENFTKLYGNDTDKMNSLNKLKTILNNGDIDRAIEQASVVDSYISGADNEKFTHFLMDASNDLKIRRQAVDNVLEDNSTKSSLIDAYKSEIYDNSGIGKIVNKSKIITPEEKAMIRDSVANKYFNPIDYFTHPDAKIRKARRVAAVGTYATGAMVTRKLQGGTLTKNEYGEKDIAGIPII